MGELPDLLVSLSHEPNVYVRVGRIGPSGGWDGLTKAVAEEVHALVVELHESYWHQYSDEARPAPASQIEMVLYSMSPTEATALMVELASKDLAFEQIVRRRLPNHPGPQLVGRLVGKLHELLALDLDESDYALATAELGMEVDPPARTRRVAGSHWSPINSARRERTTDPLRTATRSDLVGG
ncbi:hypothetical protein ACFPH6_36875 [Streptomyces xiangluensis]|uniref:Uncharacterized protein n=1 Tax=Streptomyces xiangluensis TaxID=2665720 RepID=A0ABV8Z3M4_9ACTN